MTHRYADLVFTTGVREKQARLGVASRNERLQSLGGPNDRISTTEAAFISMRDSFYMASVSETGWPYVQHRGGAAGFVRVLNDKTIAYADFRGNVQYVSVGNLHHDDRVALIFMDYANQRRLKVLGRARVVEDAEDPALVAQLEDLNYRARVERAIVITVEAFDWNCPQHITPRFTEAEVSSRLEPLQLKIQSLEAEISQHRSGGSGDEQTTSGCR